MSKNLYEEALEVVKMIEKENEQEETKIVEAIACMSANKKLDTWKELDEEEKECAFEVLSLIASKYFAYYNATKTIKENEDK